MKYSLLLMVILSLSLMPHSFSSLRLKNKSYPNQFYSIPAGFINTYLTFIIVSFLFLLFPIRKLYLSKRSFHKLVDLYRDYFSFLRLFFNSLNDLLKRINNRNKLYSLLPIKTANKRELFLDYPLNQELILEYSINEK